MKTHRNDPCPCGSGRKYKQCCHNTQTSRVSSGGPLTIALQVQSHPPPDIRLLRSCDGCTACCGPGLIINDPDLISPAGEPCPHCTPGGCGNYENRPATCRGYICNYLVEPGLRLQDRPDRMGAIVRMSLDKRQIAPMDRTTFVNETEPGGALRIMRNARWKKAIGDDLHAGVPIYFTFIGDRTGRETLLVRFFEGRLGCELTSCNDDGTPILVDLLPVYDKRLQIALAIPRQQFALEARALIAFLAGRHEVVLRPSGSTDSSTPLRFLFTHRQAMVLKGLLRLIDTLRHDPAAPRDANRIKVSG